MAMILRDLRVVAANDTDRTADLARFDRLDQRFRRAAQRAKYRLYRETGHHLHGIPGNTNPLGISVGIGLDAMRDDFLADLVAAARIERDMRSTGEFRLVGRGDDFGVEALRHVRHRRHDALVVDDHRIECPGQQHEFLHQVVAGHRQAFAHLQFVAGAAKPDQVDALRAEFPGPRNEFLVFGCLHDDIGEQRVMAVQRDVDVVGLQRAQVVEEYQTRVGELVTGIVKRVERGNVYLDLGGNAEAIIYREEMIPREAVRAGDRLRGYLR